MLKGKYIKLIKVSDDMFGGNHPNGVNKGYVLSGFNKYGIEIGEQLFLFTSLKLTSSPQGWTSIVKSFDEKKMLLKTNNSTYKVEVKEVDDDILDKLNKVGFDEK